MLPEMKTHGQVITHGYHEDLELSDRSRVTRDLDTPLEIALGVVESVRARYMDVIHDMD